MFAGRGRQERRPGTRIMNAFEVMPGPALTPAEEARHLAAVAAAAGVGRCRRCPAQA